VQGRTGGGTLGSMTSPQEEPEEPEELDELTDEEVAELDEAAAEADAHPERLIPHDRVVRPRAKLAG
jgi:hypothetical protein